MINENFKYLAKPKRSLWNILGWSAYSIVAFVISVMVLGTVSFWPGVFVALAFIFGPKIWRRL